MLQFVYIYRTFPTVRLLYVQGCSSYFKYVMYARAGLDRDDVCEPFWSSTGTRLRAPPPKGHDAVVLVPFFAKEQNESDF